LNGIRTYTANPIGPTKSLAYPIALIDIRTEQCVILVNVQSKE
jgi:hypothetical protein